MNLTLADDGDDRGVIWPAPLTEQRAEEGERPNESLTSR
jgi:hypothetical protein